MFSLRASDVLTSPPEDTDVGSSGRSLDVHHCATAHLLVAHRMLQEPRQFYNEIHPCMEISRDKSWGEVVGGRGNFTI